MKHRRGLRRRYGHAEKHLGGFHAGCRVELKPHLDRWMMGDRYGDVKRVGRSKVYVHLDRSGKTIGFKPDQLQHVYGHSRAVASGGEVQSLLFPKSKFSVSGAEEWATHHEFKDVEPDVTENTIRLRQHAPGSYIRMRTIPMGKSGVKAVVGWRTR